MNLKTKTTAINILARYSTLLMLCLLVITMTFISPQFSKLSNILNLLRQSSLLLIMALGMSAAMLLGQGVDMSVGSILSISMCISASYMRAPNDIPTLIFGIVLSLVIGALCGILNGALITYLGLPAILVTFGTREILRGLIFEYMDGGVVTNIHPAILFLGTGRVFGNIPMPIIIAIGAMLLTGFIFRRTTVGRRLFIVGANKETAKFSGLKVNRTVIFGFMFSGIMAALAGIVYLGRLGTAEAEIGKTFAFQAISAVAIGGVSFNGGIARVWSIAIGAIIINLLLNGINLMSIPSTWQGIVNGAVIIVAVLLDYAVSKKSR